MVLGPLPVKRRPARAYIKAFPHDAAIGFVFVSRPIPGVWVPFEGHIAYEAS